MQSNTRVRAALLAGLAGTATLASQYAAGAGFALLEQNGSGLGNAYAGAGAVAEDASTIFFNSAGLTQIKKASAVLSVAGINVNSDFKDSGSQAALAQPLGGTGGDAGGFAAVPATYVAVPFNESVAGGIGINAPFGLKTEYDSNWIGRYQAIKSEVKTININTALAFKVAKTLSLGLGANYQTFDAVLTSAINYDAVVAGGLAQLGTPPGTINALIAANPGLEGFSKVKGSDTTWGWDVGLLFMPSDATRIGLSYRSAMKYHVVGAATITTPTTATAPPVSTVIAGARASTNPNGLSDGPISLDVELPASARLAIAQQFGSKFQLLGEVSWTEWSSVPELRIVRTSGIGTTLKNTPEDWEDTMRYALGANYQLNDGVKLRVGAALDESPVPDSTRTPRLPDADRTWLSAGAQMKMGERINVDVGYTHIIAKDAKLNQNDGNTNAFGLLLGTQKATVDILAVQATVSF